MIPKIVHLLALCTLFTTVSCSIFSKKPEPEIKEEPPDKPRLVGRIASIPADKRFVLIQSYGTWNIETGSILTSQGPDERSANLLVTGEKLGQFAAADLQSGQVEVGDGVFTLPANPPAAMDSTVELIQNQSPNPESENVQKNN